MADLVLDASVSTSGVAGNGAGRSLVANELRDLVVRGPACGRRAEERGQCDDRRHEHEHREAAGTGAEPRADAARGPHHLGHQGGDRPAGRVIAQA